MKIDINKIKNTKNYPLDVSQDFCLKYDKNKDIFIMVSNRRLK